MKSIKLSRIEWIDSLILKPILTIAILAVSSLVLMTIFNMFVVDGGLGMIQHITFTSTLGILYCIYLTITTIKFILSESL